ncbi:MAG: ABC transporter permease, partial [Bacteroidales bacterium]|nr:ABC transporter permease [Bacteroidales bacterium]
MKKQDNIEIKSVSQFSKSFKRFRKNNLAIIAIIFILLTLLLAITGYLITPDKTPFANQQFLEMSARLPGSKFTVLKVRKNNKAENPGLIKKMIFGEPALYDYIPISNLSFKNDSVKVNLYKGENYKSDESLSIAVHNVVYAINEDSSSVLNNKEGVCFTDINNISHKIPLKDLKGEILKKNVVSKRFLMGSDRFGRDILSMLIIGTRVSLSVGFISVFISLLIGITLGAAAGYYRGRTDNIIMWLINVVWTIPSLLLVIAISFALGKGFWQVFVAVGLTMWVEVARVVRGQVLRIREKEFIEAARAIGLNDFRIIFRHILPNITGSIIVIS